MKFLGTRAKDRGRALFAMSGFDGNQQAQREGESKTAQEKSDTEREGVRDTPRSKVTSEVLRLGSYLGQSRSRKGQRLKSKGRTLAYVRFLLATT